MNERMRKDCSTLRSTRLGAFVFSGMFLLVAAICHARCLVGPDALVGGGPYVWEQGMAFGLAFVGGFLLGCGLLLGYIIRFWQVAN